MHFLLGPANFELRVTTYWISLETIVNSIIIVLKHLFRALWVTNALSVLRFCRVEHRGVVLSDDVMRDGKHQVVIGENIGWIRFQPRYVQQCNRLFLDAIAGW